VDARSAVAYLEWTLVFHNTSGVQQEARTELALPPGSVVSRVTLWVHGDEREAAFGERGQVRQAYESVVRARRDPLLVSSSGRDRVLVQCFPIEPAGDMKIRVGVTAPVVPEGLSDHGIVVLPALMARNFDAAEAASVWVESTAGLTPAAGKFATRVREDGMHVAQGEYRADERAAIRVSGLNWGSTWTPDKSTGTGGVVEQRFVERPIAPPERAIVIVDGSESMRPMQNEIGAALAAIPPQMEKRVIVATHAGVANWLPAMPWRGGVDPLPALQEALRAANDTRRTTILWIAGEQPLKLSGAETIRQVLEREAGRVTLLVLPGGGENVPLRDLDGVAGVETVPRLGSVAEDLGRLFERWRDGQFERVAARQVQHRSAIPDGAQRGSSHVVRLWAADEVARIVSIKRRDAVALAVGHKIVTPVSGAVVLETAAQYTENSLQQPSGSTPAITPEPGTWALFAIGCAALGVLSRRRRSAAHSPLV
jgi:hypothetical protein